MCENQKRKQGEHINRQHNPLLEECQQEQCLQGKRRHIEE